MKVIVSAIFIFFCIMAVAQAPPRIEWQKCLGGSLSESISLSAQSFQATTDGGYIICGSSNSVDGDLTTNYGSIDIWVVKVNSAGNIQWQKSYGGSSLDRAVAIIQAPDGGYVFAASTLSIDGNVNGNHGSYDIWLVKLSPTGTIQWQKCLGGSRSESPESLRATADGGFIVAGTTNSSDGDVTTWHSGGSPPHDDIWLIKMDFSGNILWQRCYGGSGAETLSEVITTSDGGYLITGGSGSATGDGDLNTGCPGANTHWNLRLDNIGIIQWQNCLNFGGWDSYPVQTSDGGFLIGGDNNATVPMLDIRVTKIDITGNVLWQKLFGGSNTESFRDIKITSDGGFIIAGSTISTDGDICKNLGDFDIWLLKLDPAGNKQWQRTIGGSSTEGLVEVLPTPDGGFIVAANTYSNNFDVSGNHGDNDISVFKLGFPGIPILPTVIITADQTTICPGGSVKFKASTVDGGINPIFQWKINGIPVSGTDSTIIFNTLQNADIVTCTINSNARCLTDSNGISNAVTISVDPSQNPKNFLFADTAICKYGFITLKTNIDFDTYLWNTNAITATININKPGKYWLNVMKDGCSGTDTMMVTEKQCLQGFFMPTAFTPNNDGKNDVLKPMVLGVLQQYKFTIYNRWGQIIFQSSDSGKGWDGKWKGLLQDGNAYIWTCTYQLAGEELKQEKGSFVLIR